MNKIVIDRLTVFFISVIVFGLVYKVGKKSVEISFLWAAATLLLLRLSLWSGMSAWIKPVYAATGVVERFESGEKRTQNEVAKEMLDLMLNSPNIPISKSQKDRLRNIKEQFGM